jgi:type VI secretion system secreted protein VgrG
MPLLGRDTLVTGPVAEGVLLLETFQGKESLGTPYRYDLTLLSHDSEIPVDKVLGQSLTVRIRLPSGDRFFNGIVTYFAKTGYAMNHTRYAAVVNPKLALFDYTRDCRIFFKSKAPDLVKEVLGKRGFTDVEIPLNGTYRTREYCVQYRETDLNFIQRLLEEEGIYYFFKHEDGKQTLVLADSATPHAAAPGYDSVLYLPKEHKMAIEEEHFWSLRVAGSLFPGNYTVLRGYDYEKRRAPHVQFGKKPSQAHQPGADFEDYDFPGGLSEENDANEEALVRMEADLAANTLIEVEGNTMGIGVGNLVTLRRPLSISDDFNPFWSSDDFKKQYLVTSATYSISINQFETGDVADSDEPFKATYTLLDSQTQFRPQRTATKPRIEGPQTALVVGPATDEIYTDDYGRVTVQFDWDRVGQRDEASSCWVRVAQVWAGKQWGAMHIPRIGHEVIVEFLDGDPDRPIITGRVYNTDNMPPYALPDSRTKSGIKSRSSKNLAKEPGTEKNYNEIMFEDMKGKEELHIQAEKDMSTLVKANESISVGGDRSISVSGNQSTTISGGGKSPIHCSTKVTGKYDLDVSDTIHIKAPTSITLECPGSMIEMLPGKITLKAGDGSKIVLDANALMISSGGSKVFLDTNALTEAASSAKVLLDDNLLAQSSGGASKIVLDGTVLAQAQGSGTLKLDANVTAESSGKSQLKLDGDAMLTGTGKATVKGTSEATLTATGTVKSSPAGVEATGAMVKLNS